MDACQTGTKSGRIGLMGGRVHYCYTALDGPNPEGAPWGSVFKEPTWHLSLESSLCLLFERPESRSLS